MRIKLISLFLCLTLLTVACGGGSGGTGFFNFFGLWFARFQLQTNTCDLEVRRGGNTLIDISQSSDVVTARSGLFTFQGKASDSGFLAVDTVTFAKCSDGSSLENVTSTLEYLGASGDSADARLSFFGDCMGITEQCEVAYAGPTMRISGGGGASGEVVNSDTSTDVEDPLF